VAQAALAAGAALVSVTTAAPSPLAALADCAIEVPVGPEVVSGSTRLAAGTAQKLVLNTLTTAAMVRLGHVHGRHMVDVVAANDKLRNRIVAAVADSCSVSVDQARDSLRACSWNARAAIVALHSGLDPQRSAELAAAYRTVREAIAAAG
jgi:N-acetylmuramic acid 6-phosphate etherase